MASGVSALYAEDSVRFASDFAAHIQTYRKVIRGQGVMRWARDRHLDDDLEQSALIDLARVDARFDPSRGISAHHFRLAVIPSRVSDCAQALMRMHPDTPILDEDKDRCVEEDEFAVGDDAAEGNGTCENHDSVLDAAIRAETASAIAGAIAKLPPRQREVIGYALADYTDREIAAELGVSVQAANKTRRKAIESLKRILPTHLSDD